MSRHESPGFVLAIHPTSRSFGWALFEGNFSPVNWNTANAKKNLATMGMRKFEKLLNQYKPSTMIIEKYEGANTRRGDKVRTLAQTMRAFAENRDIEVFVYSRAEVGMAVMNDPNATRYDIACSVARRLPFLQDKLPEARKTWSPEDDRQCLFDAIALGITHYALTRQHS